MEQNSEKTVGVCRLNNKSERKMGFVTSNRDETLSIHAGQMSMSFPEWRQASICEDCDNDSTSLTQARLHWRAAYGNARTYLITILSLIHHSAWMQIDFNTYHFFCRPCYRRLVRRRLLAEAARHISFVVILLAGGMVAFSLLWLITVVLDFTWKRFGLFALAFVPATACIAGVVWGRVKLDQWCVPPGLRSIAKPPFQLYNIHRTTRSNEPRAFSKSPISRPEAIQHQLPLSL